MHINASDYVCMCCASKHCFVKCKDSLHVNCDCIEDSMTEFALITSLRAAWHTMLFCIVAIIENCVDVVVH